MLLAFRLSGTIAPKGIGCRNTASGWLFSSSRRSAGMLGLLPLLGPQYNPPAFPTRGAVAGTDSGMGFHPISRPSFVTEA